MNSFHLQEIKEVDSTNNYLKNLMSKSDINEGYVVVADYQSSGKGIGSNIWESEPGKNLTFSLLLRPDSVNIAEMFMISKAVSLGIIDSLNEIKNCFTIK